MEREVDYLVWKWQWGIFSTRSSRVACSNLGRWKVKGWCVQRTYQEKGSLGTSECFFTILFLCQCMVRNFSSIDIGWVAIFSWNYSKLFVNMIPFLLQRWDCTWKLGLFSIQKYTTALCMFAHRTKVDAINEYYQLYYQFPKSTSMECVK